MTEYRLVVLGDVGVGKSNFVVRMVTNEFVGEYDPTIEDSYRKQVIIDDRICLLDVFDTAKINEFEERESYILNGEGFLLMFDLTNRVSFEGVEQYLDKCKRVLRRKIIPIVLVGTKVDYEEKRTVSTFEGSELASKFGCTYFESSSKLGTNIEEPLFQLVREVDRIGLLHTIPNKR